MRAAIFQPDMTGLSPGQRLTLLELTANDPVIDLILCPELFLSGYAIADDIRQYAEPADGPSAQRMTEIARNTKTAIAYGYPESDGDMFYNAAQVIDATGARIANHRKLALPPGFEAALFTPGDGLTLFEVGGIKAALLICYDIEFPEAVRASAEAGAQMILAPTALGDRWGVVAHRVIPARAFENGVYVLYANHAGTEGDITYLGESCIVGPDGKDSARAPSGEAFISARIDPAKVQAAQTRLPYHRDLKVLQPRLT